MDLTIHPRILRGEIDIIPSKSQAHRLLICAAFADKPTQLHCPDTNRDIEATVDCLNALGAHIQRTDSGYSVSPVESTPEKAALNCHESGSTLRFMLPVVGALGVDATFHMAGRLPERPLSPLWEEMERMGCHLSRPTANTLHCEGRLKSGTYTISGGISSQFITGLVFASALMNSESQIEVAGRLESKPYVEMTQKAMASFGVNTDDFQITGGQKFRSPGCANVEGDWSNGAFWLAAAELGSELSIRGLDTNSAQGDKAVLPLLQLLRNEMPTISAADIPDLVPILSVVAGVQNGAVFTDVQRLRLKETDRVATVAAMLTALGLRCEATEDRLTVWPGKYHSCTIDAANDHRIAMSAAIAATVATGPVTILNADSVSKSYPKFWEEYSRLGGNYEQYLR